MALAIQDLSKTATGVDLTRSAQALSELYEAYEVFCAYGTHPTSWRSLSVQLQLYIETSSTFGLLRGTETKTFSRLLSRLPTEHFAYLISDVLLALFRLSSVLPHDHDLGLCSPEEEEERPGAVVTPTLQSNRLLLYYSRRYLHRIPWDNFGALLVEIGQEVQLRTNSTYFAVCCNQSWSPSHGCYPSILLHCDIQLPSDDANILLAYAIRNGTYSTEKPITEKPKGRVELRSAFLRFPKRLIRAASISPDGPIFRDQDPENALKIRYSAPEGQAEISRAIAQVKLPSESLTTSSKKGQTITRPSRVRALSLDSFTKKDLIPSTKGAFEALWRRRRVVSWPSNPVPPTESIDVNISTNTLPQATDIRQSPYLSLDLPPPLEPLLEDSHFNLETEEFSNRDSGYQACDTESCSFSISDVNLHDRPSATMVPHDEGVDVSYDHSLYPKGSGQSCSSTHQSFVTADTHLQSLRRYQIHKEPNRDSVMSYDTVESFDNGFPNLSDYLQLLQRCDLIPGPFIETNWSGRGQHAEFSLDERNFIPLEAEKVLGKTQTALVESVRCKRVRLVRKTIRCNRRTGIKREEAVSEVQHLYRAQHSHIVRLVGTYVIGDELAILTYPCAEWDLQRFMGTAAAAPDVFERGLALRKFFTCLVNVLDFIHSCPIKHMDLKPQNILVRDIRHSSINESDPFKVYVTDFGISRSYTSVDACDTETPTSFTRAYAAVEVVLQESRGLAADIFSLGCVYAEMLATLLDISNVREASAEDESKTKAIPTFWDSLRNARTSPEYGVRPYHSVLSNIRSWLLGLPILEPELVAVRGWIMQMMDNEATKRPTARQIADDLHLPFSCLSCSLRSGPEGFEVAKPINDFSEHSSGP